MIDKIQPRKLDKDSDHKLVQKTSMVDALNVYIDERLSGQNGDAGVIKPIRGNQSTAYGDASNPHAEDAVLQPSSFRVLGSVTDQTTNVVYYFVWSEVVEEQGVYAYDPDGVFPGESSGSVIQVLAHPLFNFDPQSFVSASVIHKTPGSQSPNYREQDVILYFTDGVNEPRKVDAYKSHANKEALLSRSNFNINDYICACPKVPMGNVDFEFESDPEVLVNNFESSPGIQFAIQGVYYDGSTTAIGPYSTIAFPPSVVNRGARSAVDSLKYNKCKVIVPPLPDEIEFVKILFRQGNSSNFLEITEVPNIGSSTSDPNWVNDGADRHYNFYNNTVSLGVSPSEVSKVFDNVPQKAKHQSSASNRLVYGNFVEGYDRTSLNTSIFPIYKARPSEGVDFAVGAVPSITQIDDPADNGYSIRNIASGFEIDVTEIPDEIPANAVIEFAVTLAPDKNFHVYQAFGSYHQSAARGWSFLNLSGYPTEYNEDIKEKANPTSYINEGSPAYKQETGQGYFRSDFERALVDYEDIASISENAISGNEQYSDVERARMMFGLNFGISQRADGNSTIAGNSGSVPHGDGTASQEPLQWEYWEPGVGKKRRVMSFGTSAANPFIIQGGAVEFRVKFKMLLDTADGKTVVSSFIESYMGNEGNPFPELIQVDESGTSLIFDHEVDVNLSNKQQLPMGSAERSLIVAACFSGKDGDGVDQDVVANKNSIFGEEKRRIPQGFFIFNKGTVRFSLQKANNDDTARKTLHLRINHIDLDPEEGLFTCVRRPDPASPWWTLSPSQLDDVEADADYNALEDSLTYSGQVFQNSGFRYNLAQLNNGQNTTIGRYWCGRFKYRERDEGGVGAGHRRLWPCVIDDTNGETFRFSLLDGAAGPGGENPGTNSAYAVYKNGTQGSVSGRVLFTHYGITVRDNVDNDLGDYEDQIREDLGRMLPFRDNDDEAYSVRRDSARVGGRLIVYDKNGIGAGNDNFNYVSLGSLGPCINKQAAEATDIPTDKDCKNAIGGQAEGLGSEEQWPIAAMFSGPFFTGRIDMNPLISPGQGEDFTNIAQATQDGNDEVNIVDSGGWYYDNVGGPSTYSFLNGRTRGEKALNSIETGWLPPALDQSTVLPYVFWSDYTDQASENYSASKASFPVPIIDNEAKQDVLDLLSAGVIDDEEFNETNIPVNPNPYGAMIYEDTPGYNPNHQGFAGISYQTESPHIEVISAQTNSSTNSGKPIMSFKSSATHEFGVVYFDERGRRGPVNYIGSVYVPGYGDRPNEEGGPVYVGINLQAGDTPPPPPSWAHHYKIVYSKNTSVSEFFQYSTEGAYSVDTDNVEELNATKIYMSLNYLQGHPISYSDAWGARSQEGSPVVFQPESGDKLRIISYNSIVSGSEEVKKFPRNIVFDVIGVESLGDTNNPLLDPEDPEGDPRFNSKQGLFLILRDNVDNEGFAIRNIRNNSSFWDNNVVFEIFRPVKDIDEEKRLYFEIGPTYSIGKKDDGTLVHLNENNEEGAIELAHGDVFFRLSALNQKPLRAGAYRNLITEYTEYADAPDSGYTPEAEPNFESIYTEASSASDLFKSDAISIGRPAKIDANDKRRIRPSSMIHSDRDLPKKRKLGYSSFNPSQADDKDLEPNNGDINYMAFNDDSIMILQEKKVGHVPVDRNIISTADNERSLIASSKVLGTVRYYAGLAGTDHPESVSVIDSAAYFVSSALGKVFRASGSNGVMDISDKSMSSFFRDMLTKIPGTDKIMKFFGGHDPKKNEYLLTSKELSKKEKSGISIDQSDTPPQTFSETPAQEIVLITGAFAVPEGQENNPSFTSIVIVPLDQYYRKCCDLENPFAPVQIAIDKISDDLGVDFEINPSIILNLEAAVDNNEDLTVGQLNSLITNAIATAGIVDENDEPVIVAPFSTSSGLNLYYEFLSDCPDNDTEFVVSSVSEFRDWFLADFQGPNVFPSIAKGTNFFVEDFVERVVDLLDSEEQCVIPFTGTDSLNQYFLDAVPASRGSAAQTLALAGALNLWDETGVILNVNATVDGVGIQIPGTWSTDLDSGGNFPAVVKNQNELKAYLCAGAGTSDGQITGSVSEFFALMVEVGYLNETEDPDVVLESIQELTTDAANDIVRAYSIPYNSLFQDDHAGGVDEDFVFGNVNPENLVTKLLRGEEEFGENGIAIFELEAATKQAIIQKQGVPLELPEAAFALLWHANGREAVPYSSFGQGETTEFGEG